MTTEIKPKIKCEYCGAQRDAAKALYYIGHALSVLPVNNATTHDNVHDDLHKIGSRIIRAFNLNYMGENK